MKFYNRIMAVIGLGLLSLSNLAGATTTLLNSSYDISRELFAALNPPFEKQWAQEHAPDKLVVRQSHGGSSKQALAILQGLRADVVSYNQVTDVQVLHDKGNLIPSDWQNRLPNYSSPFYSTMAFLVRKGNPKQIQDWRDLARPGVALVFPNPKTSGNGRYTWLAAVTAANQQYQGNKEKIAQFMIQFLKNVVVFDTGGRGASTSFVERRLGDVLVSFESEINHIRQQYPNEHYEIVVPEFNILAEFPVTWIDKNVIANGTEQVAKAWLNYLYSPQAQDIITQFYYRVNNPQLMAKLSHQFPSVNLFRVEDKFQSWSQAMQTQFASGGEFDRLMAAGRK